MNFFFYIVLHTHYFSMLKTKMLLQYCNFLINLYYIYRSESEKKNSSFNNQDFTIILYYYL